MEASFINQYSEQLSEPPVFSKCSYKKLLAAYAALPFVKIENISTITSPDFGEIPLSFVRYALPTECASRPLRLLLTAGVHGDEPAGVFALYSYMASLSIRKFPIEIYAFPCVNPIGALRNSRLSSAHFDLNRQVTRSSIAAEVRALVSTLEKLEISFDAAFDLHEDNPSVPCDFIDESTQADAFYLYESSFNPLRKPIGERIARAVAQAGIPVSTQRSIYGERAINGVVQRGMERDQIFDLERFLTMNYTDQVITSETYVGRTLEERITAQTIVLESGIRALLEQSSGHR
jgi:hypothetical protein